MNKRHIKKIKTGAIMMVMSTAIVMNLAPSTFALGGDAKGTGATENTGIDDREHPNKPEGSWKIEKPKMLPPSYDGHVHVPIPFVDGKLAVNMDRLDRTNSQIEFSINKKWLAGRKIKRIGFASVRWYGFAIDNAGLYEANVFDNEWTTKLFATKNDYEEITDRHESTDRYFWIKPTFDLFYEWSNDIVFVLQLDDNTFYNGRVRFKTECMLYWYPGKDCRVKSYDESKTTLNVIYEAHEAPKKKYVEGEKVRKSDGYESEDLNIGKIDEENKEVPKPVDQPEKEPKQKEEEPQKENNQGKQQEDTKQKDETKNTPKQESETNKESKEIAYEKDDDKRLDNGEKEVVSSYKSKNIFVAKSTASEDKDGDTSTDNENDEVEVEDTSEETEQKTNDDNSSENEDKTERDTVDVPKLGEAKKESNIIFNLWWVWFIVGTIMGAILCKIFLSIHSKKDETISN